MADGKHRTFQLKWLSRWPWLVYSPSCNCGFCLPYLLFAAPEPSLGQLYSSPLLKFTRFVTACTRNECQEAHKNALAKYSEFSRTLCGTEPDVVQQLNFSHGEQLKENNEKLAARPCEDSDFLWQAEHSLARPQE